MVDSNNDLSHVGQFLKPESLVKSVVRHPGLEELVEATLPHIGLSPAKSIIVTGRSGVGKTVFVHMLAEAYAAKKGTVWRATPSELMAGQSYIGQIEQRLKDVLKDIKRKQRTVWYMPSMQDAASIGKFRGNSVAILDHLFSTF